jgi:hypothetical protein
MTKAAQQFGKRLDDFWGNSGTTQYLTALAQAQGLIPEKSGISGIENYRTARQGLTSVKRGGGQYPSTGTFGHPKLAVFFARWLDVRFAVWCDMTIDDIIRGKAVVVREPQQEPVVEVMDAAQHFKKSSEHSPAIFDPVQAALAELESKAR